MGHADPLLAVPLGVIWAVIGVWIVVSPDRLPRGSWFARAVDRVAGERVTEALLRAGGAVMAVGSTWLVWHAGRGLVSG